MPREGARDPSAALDWLTLARAASLQSGSRGGARRNPILYKRGRGDGVLANFKFQLGRILVVSLMFDFFLVLYFIF